MRKSTAFVLAIAGICLWGLALQETYAQGYPSKTVTLVVPYPPGGRTDLTARVVAEYLKQELRQAVVVANHAGGGGVVGAKKVAASAPDGYTLGFLPNATVAAQYTLPTPSDLKDYEPIALINADPAVVAVSSASPHKDLRSFAQYAKAHPDQLRYGNSPGGGTHLMNLGFWKAAGNLKFLEIPYTGGGLRATALAGNHLDADLDVAATYRTLVDAGKLRLLAVAAETRSPLIPDVPTFREQGIDYVGGNWHGIFAPKSTPLQVLQYVDKALKATAENPKFIAAMHQAFLGVRYLNRTEFTKFLAAQDKEIRQTVEEFGLGAKK